MSSRTFVGSSPIHWPGPTAPAKHRYDNTDIPGIDRRADLNATWLARRLLARAQATRTTPLLAGQAPFRGIVLPCRVGFMPPSIQFRFEKT
jgi:hypothetical protein